MASRTNKTECVITCWGIAALVGLLAMVLLYWMAEFDAVQAIFTGGLIGTGLGLLLSLTVCGTQTAADDLASDNKPAVRYAARAEDRKAARIADAQTVTAVPNAAVEAAGSSANASGTSTGSATSSTGSAYQTAPAAAAATQDATASASAGSATPSKAFAMQPSKPLAGQQELAKRKGEWKYDGNAEGADAAASGKPAVKTETAKAKPAASETKPEKAKAKTATAETASGTYEKPDTMLSAPRAEGKDDLKLISGVGPKLEQTLNDLGVYHFDQVAKWNKSDIAWVDGNLRFKGRIERDDWMSQAKILAKGGETEFSKKKKKT